MGEQWRENGICASLFTPDRLYLTSQLPNHPRDSTDLTRGLCPRGFAGTGQPTHPGTGVQLPHSYFTPSFDFILYSYFFNIVEYNLFYIMYTNYITVLYRAKHELHGKNQEKNDEVPLHCQAPRVLPVWGHPQFTGKVSPG